MTLPLGDTTLDHSGTTESLAYCLWMLTDHLLCHLQTWGQSSDRLHFFHVLSSKRLSQQESDAGDGENSKKMLKKRSNL